MTSPAPVGTFRELAHFRKLAGASFGRLRLSAMPSALFTSEFRPGACAATFASAGATDARFSHLSTMPNAYA
jgi:hypothetical protein